MAFRSSSLGTGPVKTGAGISDATSITSFRRSRLSRLCQVTTRLVQRPTTPLSRILELIEQVFPAPDFLRDDEPLP
jgi:hypothetical protein